MTRRLDSNQGPTGYELGTGVLEVFADDLGHGFREVIGSAQVFSEKADFAFDVSFKQGLAIASHELRMHLYGGGPGDRGHLARASATFFESEQRQSEQHQVRRFSR